MKTDALARRLRFAPPNPDGRRLALSETDVLIFGAIARHGPLPTHYFFEFVRHVRRDYSRFQNRLTALYHGDPSGPYLIRPQQQFAAFEARYQHLVYDLAPRAQAALLECGAVCRTPPKRSDPFVHQLMGACVGASLELSAMAKGLRYIPRDEIVNHPRCPEAVRTAPNPLALPLPGSQKRALIPDDLFGLEYPGAGFRFFAVEIDRNTESISRRNLEQSAFDKKVAGYLQILAGRLYRDWWGVPNLSVLTVTTNATHARNLVDFVRRQDIGSYASRFAFAVDSSFGPNWRVPRQVLTHLLEQPWTTPDALKDISKP